MDPRKFSYREGNFSIVSSHYDEICQVIIKERHRLDSLIEEFPLFGKSFAPLPHDMTKRIQERNNPLASRMLKASQQTGVGPMAAVAGTFAQYAAEEAIRMGDNEVIVENGGDLYASSHEPVILGIHAARSSLSGKCGFKLMPEQMPMGVCSSSGTMGHSASLGKCDLATVFSKDNALADAAATLAANLVSQENDLAPTAERINAIDGVEGVFLVLGEDIGMAGKIPEIISIHDKNMNSKITRDVFWQP